MAEGYENHDAFYKNVRHGRLQGTYTTTTSGYAPTVIPVTFSAPFEDDNYQVFVMIGGPYDAWTTVTLTTNNLTKNGFSMVVNNISNNVREITCYFNWLAIHN